MTDTRRTNAEIRQWYREQVARILDFNRQWITEGYSARERAERAWRIRHDARIEARNMMTEPREVELLQARDMAVYGDPNGPTFEFLVEQARHAGLEEYAIYEAIIDGSYRTNADINRRLGL
ncbi:MAG: hypothetical protein ETSY2_21725 [Candidatus Entotheonella gemina]|uniref:Uncharacterized protein n=1 Tax=Candidatus Entotheonella gemina TaxID=1429439 RepID=W4M635_9BACT|nr:MAG: hypothetical protein ETSY2_21725 [Candidatus Entotheonella gemina]